MRTQIQSLSELRRIVAGNKRCASFVLTLLMTGLVVTTPAQEQHKKHSDPNGVDIRFDAIDVDEAAVARATVVHDFGSDPTAAIHNPTEVKIPAHGSAGIASPYPLTTVISGFQGTIGRIAVRLNNLSHTCPSDLHVVLVGPQGQKVRLLAVAGGCEPAEGIYLTLQDGATPLSGSFLASGTYAPGIAEILALPSPSPPSPYSTSLSSFAGADPNGTWSLFVYDRGAGDVGSLSGFTLLISPQHSNNTPVPIPDCPVGACPPAAVAAVESPINVSGLTAPIAAVTVSFHITHTWDADLDIALVGPDNTTIPLVEDRGFGGDNFGTSCANRTVFDDAATTAIGIGTAPFAGTYRPESLLSVFNGMSGAAANGVWKLRIKDDAAADVGVLQCWSITFTLDDGQTVQSPTGLRVASIVGNEVTLRWNDQAAGLEPTNYVLEGGLSPGETLASIVTNSSAPTHTFVAPTGSFYVRVRAQSGNQTGPPSNEIPLHVNVPLPPSPPGVLLGVVEGSTLTLTWRNTFDGGAPSSLILVVTGDANASIPLPLTESVSFADVPAGSYGLQLRAVNDAGVSDAALSANGGHGPVEYPWKFTFPAASCSGAPLAPTSFLAYRSGNTVHVTWDPPVKGWAPTEYVLNVDGDLVGSVTTTARELKGAVGPGTYELSVAAKNPCGVSAATPVRYVGVP